ncbi:heterokaryon incompatibility protein-domain-containing protein [Apiospora sp. TS-2023a]
MPIQPREVAAKFEAEIVQEWLRVCQKSHANCVPHGWLLWVTKLIDCNNGGVVSVSTLDTIPDYVALSYVWGEPSSTPAKPAKDRSALPQLVEDAISVTKQMGFQYIWVDRYCVEQKDSHRKHEQIMNMDSIYENAALTIIAASGRDPAQGLLGVSSDRLKKEDPFRHDNFSISWVPPTPHYEILESRWSTRGWTYQEATLSRRRLVFTEHQVYFECRSMACCESLQMPLQPPPEELKPRSGFQPFRIPHLFSIPLLDDTGFAPPLHRYSNALLDAKPILDAQPSPQKAIAFNAYTQCAERYSRRTLTYDSDSLNAFGGMIKRFESLERATLRHLWGMPFFDQRDDISPGEIVDYTGFFLAGLSWYHCESPKVAPPHPRRRKRFPSWSWTGWEGAVTWPQVATTYDVRAPDPDVTLASIQLTFEDGTTRSIPDVRRGPERQRPGVGDNARPPPTLDQYPKALLLQTSAVTSGDFPHAGSGTGEGFWFPSDPGLTEARMVQQVRSGHLKALRLGTIGEDGFLLVVKKKGRSFYRVGLMRVDRALVTERVQNQDSHVFKLK